MKIASSVFFVFLFSTTFSQVCSDCQKLYDAKDYEKVIQKIATSNDSLHTEDLVLLAKSYQSLGMKKDAIGAYSHILLNDENNLEALVCVGALFIDMEQYDNAEYATDKALRIDPKNQNAIYNKAVVYYFKNDLTKFNTYVDEIIAKSPKNAANAELLFVKAMKYLEQQNFKSAVETFELAGQLNNKLLNLNFYLAYALYKENKLEEAKSKFKQSIELNDEQNIDSYYYLAQIYKNENNKIDACDAYTKAINLGDITITKEADAYCQEKKTSKIKLFDRGYRPAF